MTHGFRPAERSQAKPLIGIYAESSAGKTLSALLLARGFVGPAGKVGMIETEGGRGEAYADDERVAPYLVRPIRGDFAPAQYGTAITEAESAGLDALIIDSASHEWEGAGGVLSMAAANQAANKKGPIVWQQPKLEHQRNFMLRFMQTPIPLVIMCMRAKYPMLEVKGQWTRSTQLEPKQADDILFEMFVHGWIDHEHRFHGTKYTRDDLRAALVDGQPITIESGRRLAEMSRARGAQPKGGDAPSAASQTTVSTASPTTPPKASSNGAAPSPTPDVGADEFAGLVAQFRAGMKDLRGDAVRAYWARQRKFLDKLPDQTRAMLKDEAAVLSEMPI